MKISYLKYCASRDNQSVFIGLYIRVGVNEAPRADKE